MSRPVSVGAVLYDPRVSVIWEIIREFFETNGCPMDVRLYSDYDRQNTAFVDGDIDIAWNSPLAWLDAERRTRGACRAIAMRDTDRDRVSHVVVREKGGAGAGIDKLADLRGRTIAFGATDSPQATLIPMGLLSKHGLEPGRDYRPLKHDILVGKHGDHVGGELEALQAVKHGAADASCVLDLNWTTWTQDGTADPAQYRIVATTERFDHCVFTVRSTFTPDDERRWLDVLYSMSYENPKHREMMDLEGLKAWLPGRTTGFGPLGEAVRAFRFFEDTPSS